MMESRSAVLRLEARLRGLKDRLRDLDSDRSPRGAIRRSAIRELSGFGVPFLLSNVFHALTKTDDRSVWRVREVFEASSRDGVRVPRRITGNGKDVGLARDIAALARDLERFLDDVALSEVGLALDEVLIEDCRGYFDGLCSERSWASLHGDPWPLPKWL